MLDRAYGCLVGAAIGDAMGMPASFMPPAQIKEVYGRITDFLKPAEEQTAHLGLMTASITDDTEESLIVASVLIEAGEFNTDIFIEKMRKWAVEKKALESTIIGPSTRRFLETIVRGGDYLEAGKTGDTNGGAMRAAPIGLFNHGNVEKAVRDAMACTRPSHGSKPGMAGACAVAAAIATAVEGGCTPEAVIQNAIYGAVEGEKAGFDIPAPSVAARIELARELVEKNRGRELEEICHQLYRYLGASMKSYESIPISLGVFYAAQGNFEKGLISIINIGDDADTNGSIVGALCGAFGGARGIRPQWIEKVQRSNGLNFLEIARSLISRGKGQSPAQGL
ncbi:MAG: ADP-ribosylglycohydrolase family protein [Clostridiales bacterium]|jgi:ADP-ribosylglycohydrolase|nr:ADP-ribosylglycohydrolase family protein [Eubacteriales bacterium]MDH7565687.1 ADP-ribosylglycohydrolase family protein [Clostridiales bacterium]